MSSLSQLEAGGKIQLCLPFMQGVAEDHQQHGFVHHKVLIYISLILCFRNSRNSHLHSFARHSFHHEQRNSLPKSMIGMSPLITMQIIMLTRSRTSNTTFSSTSSSSHKRVDLVLVQVPVVHRVHLVHAEHLVVPHLADLCTQTFSGTGLTRSA